MVVRWDAGLLTLGKFTFDTSESPMKNGSRAPGGRLLT